MSLSINVGLSRKASKDYQSSGFSINVTAELDQTLLARPDELQKQINELYTQAEHALARQTDSIVLPEAASRRERYEPEQRRDRGSSPYHDQRRDRGYDNGSRRSGNGGGEMTQSQRRAILSICDRLRIDPRLEARDIIGRDFDDLGVRQASELIDHLKSLQASERRR